ncbi:vWA domain-containing protein [Salinibaculum salinum]|uniref:vWA domain-containing protein n=1 Tax=Salinibaculum salinum TaxID=3131996 RepID=UPI0030EC4E4E
MTDKGMELTRRKILASMGAVGAAGAVAGMGTSAYFSDEESFTNNSLTAGELDLKVDWEEHYYDGKGTQADEATLVSGDPNPTEVDYYLPAVRNPDASPIALNFTNSQDDLWDATAIEAFPDEDDDGIQDDGDITCDDLESVENALASEQRTSGNGQGDGGDPLVQLQDIKPGDFGEVTFSFHLCDNPGYVWMQGELVRADENGVTEPEGDDPQEEEGVVELLDEVRTRMWYDENCDNQIETGLVDVMIAVDDSISSDDEDQDFLRNGLEEFVSGLATDTEVGLLTFGDGEVTNFQGLGDSVDISGIAEGSGGGNTPLPPALDIADQELDENAREDVEKVIVVFTDGGPNYENVEYSAGGHTAPRNADYTLDNSTPEYDEGGGGNDAQGRPGGISDGELKETAHVAEMIRDSGTRIITVNIDVAGEDTDLVLDLPAYLKNEIASSQAYAKNVKLDDLAAVANSLSAVTMEENLFFEGSLREALAELSSGHGIPLDGDTSTAYNEFSGSVRNLDEDDADEVTGGGPTDADRECFAGAGTTHCVGFEWWLPIDHANQIQSDIAEFNLGFYTEQCRHNDGSGQSTPAR